MSLTRGFDYARMLGYENPPIMNFPEGAGQSFKKGELVVASGGYIVVGAADPSAETIVGIALADASGTQGTQIPVMCALPGVIFEGQLQNAAADAAIAATDMLKQYGVNLTSNKWWIDTDETTSKIVTIVAFKDATTTVNGVVEFVFNPLGTVWGSNIT